MFSKKSLTAFFFSLIIGSSAAQAAAINVESNFEGGLYGRFDIAYQSAAPGLKLQSLRFDLQAPLFTDPSFASPGVLLPLPFSSLSGAASTGFLGIMGVNDGATAFTLLFNDFDAGETFGFNLDVDTPCGNIFCQLPGAITTGSEFAGTTITGVFGGYGYLTTSLQGQFAQTGALTASAAIDGSAPEVPEPGTMGLLGLSFSALGCITRLRKRRA